MKEHSILKNINDGTDRSDQQHDKMGMTGQTTHDQR